MKPFIIPLFIPHRGCPRQCVYCDQNITAAPPASDEFFSETIREWLSFRKASLASSQTQIAFYGGSFTSLPLKEQNRLLSITRPFIEGKGVGSVRISARPDSFSREGISLLEDFSVRTVELGVQSMDEEVLRLSRRGYRPEAVEKAALSLQNSGFETGIQLMPGLPGDTREKFLRSVKETIRLKPDFARIYPTVVIKNTLLEKEFFNGNYKPLTLEEAVEWCAEGTRLFHKSNIRVIRLGLQSTPSIQAGGGITAGPFHPSFGQLVKSRMALAEMINMYRNYQKGFGDKRPFLNRSGIVFEVPWKELSNYRGQRNGNLSKLKEVFDRDFEISGSRATGMEDIQMSFN